MSDLPATLPPRQRIPLRISTDIPLLTRHPSSSSSSPTNQSTTSSGESPTTGDVRCFFHVVCMYDFNSSDPVHLPFHKNEVLTVIKQERSGWSAAMRSGGDRIGWIPSSFVLPLDRSKILQHPDEDHGFNDPLSAVHDPWAPVSGDYGVISIQLVTPTDLILYKGFFDDRAWSPDRESLANLSIGEQSPDLTEKLQFPESPLLSWPTSHPLADAALHHRPHLWGTDDQTPLRCLTASVGSDKVASELISSLDVENWLTALKSAAASLDGTRSGGTLLDQSESFELSASVPGHSVPDVRLLDLTIRGPDNLAQHLSVLMHTLYANIRQHDCLDWMTGRRSTEVTGLRQFLDTHHHITSWARKSVLAYDDTPRQSKTLDYWTRVAEECQALCNFDSLGAIVLALSGPSLTSLESAWARCTRRQTFAMLCNMLDVSNKFHRLRNLVDSAKGPSIPFVRGYLEGIRELHMTPRQSGCAGNADLSAVLVLVSNMLRHQSSPYDFKHLRAQSRGIGKTVGGRPRLS